MLPEKNGNDHRGFGYFKSYRSLLTQGVFLHLCLAVAGQELLWIPLLSFLVKEIERAKAMRSHSHLHHFSIT